MGFHFSENSKSYLIKNTSYKSAYAPKELQNIYHD